MNILDIKNLYVKIKDNTIINNLNLKIPYGQTHVIMGPNGSGKSTLSLVITGDNKYKIIKGSIKFKNKDIKKYSPDKRSKKGIFTILQKHIEIPGLNNRYFLYKSLNTIREYNKKKKLNSLQFTKKLKKNIKLLNFPLKLLSRSVNKGFSGGERKKNDILQMLLIKPKLIILDEIDSGLDIDTFKNICNLLNKFQNKKRSFLIITHSHKMFKYLNIDLVHILYNGKIIKSDYKEIISMIENKGYDCFISKK